MSWSAMLTAVSLIDEDTKLGKDGAFVEITEAEASDIREAVRAQLLAFREGDAERAWALATDDIQATFGTPGKLLAAVRDGYAPLAGPGLLRFGDLSISQDGLGQWLELVDPKGRSHHALVLVARDEQGPWRIDGCIVTGRPERRDAA